MLTCCWKIKRAFKNILLRGVVSIWFLCRHTLTLNLYNIVDFGCENEFRCERDSLKSWDRDKSRWWERSCTLAAPQSPPQPGGLLCQEQYVMLIVAVAEEERDCLGLMSTPFLLPLGCSFGQICYNSDGWIERCGSLSGREKKERDRIVWKLLETRWSIIWSFNHLD